MKYLLLLLPFLFACKTTKIPQLTPKPKVDTFYVYTPPIEKVDTIKLSQVVTYLDTTICPVDTVEQLVIKTKVIKGETVTITKTVSDTVVITIREKIPSIECDQPDNLLWKIVSGSTSLLFLLFLFFKRKQK